MAKRTKELQPQDFSASVDYLMTEYESHGVTFPDGFQKDAIQNAAGARKNDGWKNWQCKIYLKKYKGTTLLVVEDCGTEGLTGPNYSTEEISELIKNKELNDRPDWRLARFSSRNVSGGNKTGAGKFGVGKSVYSAASRTYKYWFDSLTSEGNYVANENDNGYIFTTAFEGDEAKKEIKKATGLDPKETTGTRIIIFDPVDELVDSINSGEIVKYIHESWWVSLDRMKGESGIYLNGKKVETPDLPKPINTWTLKSPYKVEPGHIIKHYQINVSNDENIPWSGIAYFRVGMKICEVTVDDIPPKLRGKVWGYVEVDQAWEEELATIEDSVHYGLLPHKSNTNIYRMMSGYVNQATCERLREWGYIKDPETATKRINDMIQKVSEKAFSIADSLGFDDLGKGDRKKTFEVRWTNVEYPTADSRKVITGDTIKLAFRIKNNSVTTRTFNYTIKALPDDDGDPIIVNDNKIKVEGGCFEEVEFDYKISPKTAFKYQKNDLLVSVSSTGLKTIDKKILFFYDTNEPSNEDDVVLLSISAKYPRENSRRINSDEALEDIVYTIYNKRAHPLDYRLNVSVLLPKKNGKPEKITDICSIEGSVGAESETDISISPITFDAATYDPFLKRGELLLRGRLVSTAKGHGFARGEKITQREIVIFFNKDEKTGKWNSFEPLSDNRPDIHKRSWSRTVGTTRQITINVGHPAFKRIQEDDYFLEDYLSQEILKQYVMLYLQSGNNSMFNIDPEKDTPDKMVEAMMSTVEEAYYQSFQGE